MKFTTSYSSYFTGVFSRTVKISYGLGVVFVIVASFLAATVKADIIPGASQVRTFAGANPGEPTNVLDNSGGFVFSSSTYSGAGYTAQSIADATYFGGDLFVTASETNGNAVSASAQLDGTWEIVLPSCANPTLSVFLVQFFDCGLRVTYDVTAIPPVIPGISVSGDASEKTFIDMHTDFGPSEVPLTGVPQEWIFTVPMEAHPTSSEQDQTLELDAFVSAFAGSSGQPGSATVNYYGTFSVSAQVFDSNGNLVATFVPSSAAAPEPGTLALFGSGLLCVATLVRKKTRR